MIKIFHHHVSSWSLLLAAVEVLIFFVLVFVCVSPGISGQWFGAVPIPMDMGQSIAFTSLIVLITTLVMGATGLYSLDIMFSMDAVLARLALSFSLSFVLFDAIALLLSRWHILDLAYFRLAILVIPLCATMALALRILFSRLARRDGLQPRVLVIGCGSSAVKLAGMSGRERYRFKIVGYVDCTSFPGSSELAPIFPATAIATPDAALALIEAHSVDHIVVASDERRGLPHHSILQCRLKGIRVEDFSSFWERHAAHVDLESLKPSWLIFNDGFALSRDHHLAKACFDYGIALSLLILTAPVTLVTAILIKATSSGPVFFRQERVGRNGRIFNILKFRSMTVDAERSGPQWAKVNDSRVTPIGRFIRKVRIDEIPQVFNLLRGEMSFIGPRPERPHFVRQLSAAIPYFDERHRVKPGLSGWAQVNYPYGASVEDARHKLSYDLYYLKNGSFFLDCLILLRTVHVVLWSFGAR